jgi:hypothetical protein
MIAEATCRSKSADFGITSTLPYMTRPSQLLNSQLLNSRSILSEPILSREQHGDAAAGKRDIGVNRTRKVMQLVMKILLYLDSGNWLCVHMPTWQALIIRQTYNSIMPTTLRAFRRCCARCTALRAWGVHHCHRNSGMSACQHACRYTWIDPLNSGALSPEADH